MGTWALGLLSKSGSSKVPVIALGLLSKSGFICIAPRLLRTLGSSGIVPWRMNSEDCLNASIAVFIKCDSLALNTGGGISL